MSIIFATVCSIWEDQKNMNSDWNEIWLFFISFSLNHLLFLWLSIFFSVFSEMHINEKNQIWLNVADIIPTGRTFRKEPKFNSLQKKLQRRVSGFAKPSGSVEKADTAHNFFFQFSKLWYVQIHIVSMLCLVHDDGKYVLFSSMYAYIHTGWFYNSPCHISLANRWL